MADLSESSSHPLGYATLSAQSVSDILACVPAEDWPFPKSLGADEATRYRFIIESWKEDQTQRINHIAEAEHISQQSLLQSYESDGTHWFGTGKQDVVIKTKSEMVNMQVGRTLGAGSYGVVKAFTCRSLSMARKKLRAPYGGYFSTATIKAELDVLKKLSGHRHFVQHVGTYTWDSKLYILTFPVAHCNLEWFLDECEHLHNHTGDVRKFEPMARIVIGSVRTDYLLEGNGTTNELLVATRHRLDEILGCLATAVEWMHTREVRHLDLKPANILLSPGELYITDFGLSRDFMERTSTETELNPGFTPGYSAPEMEQKLRYSPSAADVYSLGCIFLHIAAVRYGSNRRDCKNILNRGLAAHSEREARIETLLEELQILSAAQANELGETVAAEETEQLYFPILKRMLADQFDVRPSMTEVDGALRTYGGAEEKFHGTCCKKKQALLSFIGFIKDKYQVEITEPLDEMSGYLALALYRHAKSPAEERELKSTILKLEGRYGESHPRTLAGMVELATCLRRQRKYEETEAMCIQILQRQRRALGPKHPNTIEALRRVASQKANRGQYKEARELMQQVFEWRLKVQGTKHPETLNAMDDLATVLQGCGQYADTEKLLRQSMLQKEQTLGSDYGGTLETAHHLSTVLALQERYSDSESLARRTLERRMRTHEFDHPSILESLDHLANVLRSQGNEHEAQQVYQKVKAQRRRMKKILWGEEHACNHYILESMHDLEVKRPPSVQGSTTETIRYNSLDSDKASGILAGPEVRSKTEVTALETGVGDVFVDDALAVTRGRQKGKRKGVVKDQRNDWYELDEKLSARDKAVATALQKGDNEEAEESLTTLLRIRELAKGFDSPETHSTMDRLARALFRQGKLDEAAETYRRVLWLRTRCRGEEHPKTLQTMQNLGETLRHQKRYSDAIVMLQWTFELRTKVLGERHHDTLLTGHCYARALGTRKNYQEAEKVLRRVLPMRQKVLGWNDPQTLQTAADLALTLVKIKDYPHAEEVCLEFMHAEEVLGKDSPEALNVLVALGLAFHHRDQYESEEWTYRELLERRERKFGDRHHISLRTRDYLTDALLIQDKYDEAEDVLRATVRLRKEAIGPENAQTITTMHVLAEVLAKRFTDPKTREADELLEEILALRDKVLGPDDIDTVHTKHSLAKIAWRQKDYERAIRLLEETLAQKENLYSTFSNQAYHPQDTSLDLANAIYEARSVSPTIGKRKDKLMLRLYKRIADARSRSRGFLDPETLDIMSRIQSVLEEPVETAIRFDRFLPSLWRRWQGAITL